jgi:hypothetical protein
MAGVTDTIATIAAARTLLANLPSKLNEGIALSIGVGRSRVARVTSSFA